MQPSPSVAHRSHVRRLPIELFEARIAPATFVVTNLNDAGDGSLRDAIEKADATPAPDLITFQKSLTGTIVLTSGELDISTPLKIKGPGGNKLSIDALGASGIFIVSDRDNSMDSPVTISGLALTGGVAGMGGAIFANESLTLIDCTITNCRATSSGGAVWVGGEGKTSVVISDCQISGNVATQAIGGGVAISVPGGIKITNTTFANNSAEGRGGGAWFFTAANPQPGSKIQLSDVVFTGNHSNSSGGGISIQAAGQPAFIKNTTIVGNSAGNDPTEAGGGIEAILTKLTVSNSLFASNTATWGGAIQLNGSQAVVKNTRFIGNNAPGKNGAPGDGGAIYCYGSNPDASLLSLTSCTLAGNSTTGNGGAIFAYAGGAVALTKTTVSGNSAGILGGGLYVSGAGNSKTSLTLVASSFEGNRGTDGGGIFTDAEGPTVVKSTRFLGNTATSGNGGGMVLRTDGAASVSACVFQNNIAAFDGGGIAIEGSGATTVSAIKLLNNSAGRNGGGILASGTGLVKISSIVATANFASEKGGGLFSATSLEIKSGSVIRNGAALSGGGLFVFAGVINISPGLVLKENFAPSNPDSN